MKHIVATWIRRNWQRLLHWDIRIARLFGARRGFTLSGMAWELEQAGNAWGQFWRARIDGIFMFLFAQANHCRDAYFADLERHQAA